MVTRFHRQPSENETSGFTLFESLVTVGLTVVMLSIYSSMQMGLFNITRTQFRMQAADFAQEELDVLRTMKRAELLNRTNGRLLGQAFKRGQWTVVQSGTSKVLRLPAAASDSLGETGLAILPGNYRSDFTFGAKVRANGASPNGWGAGIAFRYRDAENHYRFRFSSGGIALDEVYHGTVTTLWSQSATYSKDTWYTLEVTAAENVLTLKRDGSTLATVTTTGRFLKGDTALISLAGALTDFDDVIVTENLVTTSWVFEDVTLGTYPEDWRRYSPFDLPAGNATLTIEDYLGQASMKRATVKVSWNESGSVRTVTNSTIIAR